MSVAPYPEYKDSGVEWIGEMPSHWDQRRLGNYLAERREKVSDKEFPPLSVTKNGIVPQLDNAAKTDDGDNRKKVCAGDFVINGRSDRKGSSGLSSLEGSVSLINIVLRPHAAVEMRFIGWLLKSALFQEEFYRYGKGIVADLWSTNFSEMRNIVLAMPPVLEQSAIAAFLDQETRKIDALVAEQEMLIALLKEKRQAVISQAVTKGLNPNAPMKDSGIEWLGQVPAHWEICMLRRAFRSVDYGISDALSLEGEIVVLRMNNIQNGSISFEDLKYTDTVDPQLFLEAGDLLYNRTNSLDLIGKVGVYKGELGMPLSFASYLVRFRLSGGVPDYFAYLLNTRGVLGIVRSSAYVAIGQCNLNPTKYGEISVALPAPEEQAAIVDFLNAEVSRTDTLIVRRQII
jgi:type I restriction enzyme S subunit